VLRREVYMAQAGADKYQPYREALRRRVCAVCLDGADDGSCRLSGERSCAIDGHLPQLLAAVRDVREGRDDTYAAAVEARVCRHCADRDDHGACSLRQGGRCALVVYLPLVVEAIEEVDGRDEEA
jgi:hypothetical protein